VGNNGLGREDPNSIVDLAALGEDILTEQLLGEHENTKAPVPDAEF
jgi:hypothetical protein